MYIYKATVLRVIDGDSLITLLDLGCHVTIEKSIRLYGINAPEMRGDTKLAGMEARDFLSEQVINKQIFIQTFKDKTEKYGRLLGKLYLSDPSSDAASTINDLMIASGHAVPYME